MQGWLKRWTLPDGAAARPTRGSLVQRIAAARGIDADCLDAFAAPTFDHLKPSEDLCGAVEVGDRLANAVRAGKHIAIFGDYDADGMCAAAILVHLLREVQGGESPRVYIPERATEGYGLSLEAVRQLAADGSNLIVTVDCGITALEEVELAREMGMEVLITDHHTARSDGRLPNAHAIAHPALGGGDGTLCGAAVAWKVGWRSAAHGAAVIVSRLNFGNCSSRRWRSLRSERWRTSFHSWVRTVSSRGLDCRASLAAVCRACARSLCRQASDHTTVSTANASPSASHRS